MDRSTLIYVFTNWTKQFVGVVARVESLRGRMGESERQIEGLFESVLSESFGGT